MHDSGLNLCYFVIDTEKDIFIKTIIYDEKFFK